MCEPERLSAVSPAEPAPAATPADGEKAAACRWEGDGRGGDDSSAGEGGRTGQTRSRLVVHISVRDGA